MSTYETRLRKKIEAAQAALTDVASHIAVRDRDAAEKITDFSGRLDLLAPPPGNDLDDEAGPAPRF